MAQEGVPDRGWPCARPGGVPSAGDRGRTHAREAPSAGDRAAAVREGAIRAIRWIPPSANRPTLVGDRSAVDLVQDFREAEATGLRKQHVHDLVRVDLLVIED